MPGILTTEVAEKTHGKTASGVPMQVVLPNTLALVGQVIYQQVVPVELSGLGSITALTSTNALSLTIGSF